MCVCACVCAYTYISAALTLLSVAWRQRCVCERESVCVREEEFVCDFVRVCVCVRVYIYISVRITTVLSVHLFWQKSPICFRMFGGLVADLNAERIGLFVLRLYYLYISFGKRALFV